MGIGQQNVGGWTLDTMFHCTWQVNGSVALSVGRCSGESSEQIQSPDETGTALCMQLLRKDTGIWCL